MDIADPEGPSMVRGCRVPQKHNGLALRVPPPPPTSERWSGRAVLRARNNQKERVQHRGGRGHWRTPACVRPSRATESDGYTAADERRGRCTAEYKRLGPCAVEYEGRSGDNVPQVAGRPQRLPLVLGLHGGARQLR